MTEQLDQIISESRVIVCAGSGGVGKTTISAAIGVRAAQLGRKVLVLTVDPAKRLATALGLDLADDSERVVPLEGVSGSLSAAVIDSKKVFDQFIIRHANGAEVVTRIMKNRLYHQLSTTLAGSQEFTALERLLQAAQSEKYDLVVLDTPPTQHAMDFLTAPQRIAALFQESITKWFGGENENKGFFAGIVGRGTRVVLKSLENLTGAQFIEELIDFFAAVRSVQHVLKTRSEDAHKLLIGAKTSFIVVTSFDAAKLLEAKYLQERLSALGYRMRGVVINRAFPEWLPNAVSQTSNDPQLAVAYAQVLKSFGEFKDYYAARYDMYEKFAKSVNADVAVLRIPEYRQDIHGVSDLQTLAEVLAHAKK